MGHFELLVMKQPELGKKIIDLRKTKRLTQEELVEKCNISIRTIQRIEAGEVTPRDYTVKTIFAALEFDLDDLPAEKSNIGSERANWLKTFFLIQINPTPNGLIKHMNQAWVFGIVCFILKSMEGAGDYARFTGEDIFGDGTYVAIKIFVVIAYIFFMRGFIIVGYLYNNYLLKMISSVLIGVSILVVGFDVISILSDSIDFETVIFVYAISYGVTGLIFGYGLTHLPRSMGRTPKLAGVLEVIAGCFSLTVILSFFSPFILIPAEILEIMMIYKAIEIVRRNQQSKDAT
jgi:transcriptional regulator with XRE-family HTH domain